MRRVQPRPGARLGGRRRRVRHLPRQWVRTSRSLLLRAQRGDRRARQILVVAHEGLVRAVVRRYRGWPLDPDELLQVGRIALFKAILRFDPTRGTRFSTYAVPVILGEVRRHLRDHGRAFPSRWARSVTQRVEGSRQAWMTTHGREPTVAELAAAAGVEVSALLAAWTAQKAPLSLDEPVGIDEDRLPRLNGLGGEEPGYERVLLRLLVRSLPPRQRQVVVLRYFLDRSQSEVAQVLGISQPQVSRIEQAALRRLAAMWRTGACRA